MEIIINQQRKSVPGDYTLEQVLVQLFPDSLKGIAAAVNQHVIPRTGWSGHQLFPEDNIVLIRATQGG